MALSYIILPTTTANSAFSNDNSEQRLFKGGFNFMKKQNKKVMRSNKKDCFERNKKNYIKKVSVILNSEDDILKNAIESTIDVFFEKTMKDIKRLKYYL